MSEEQHSSPDVGCRSQSLQLYTERLTIPAAIIPATLCALTWNDLCAARVLSQEWHCAVYHMADVRALHAVTSLCLLKLLPVIGGLFSSLPNGILALRLNTSYSWLSLKQLSRAASCCLLRELCVSLVEGATDSDLADLLSTCSHLVKLEVSDYDLVAGYLEGSFLGRLPNNLAALHLKLFPHIGDNRLKRALSAAPNLEVVELEGLDRLTDVGIMSLGSLPHLKELRLAFTRLDVQPQVSEEAISAALGGRGQKSSSSTHQGLSVLDISVRAGGPLVLSEAGVPFITRVLVGHRNLRHLSLMRVSGLADAGFAALPSVCPHLQNLSLYRPGEGLTGSGLKSGLMQLHSLEQLSLGHVSNFREAFAGAVTCSDRLEYLELTRYFRSAADQNVLELLQEISNFAQLKSAVFRATFSVEQVASTVETLAKQSHALAIGTSITCNMSGENAVFQVELDKAHDPLLERLRCEVILERCPKADDFR